MDANHAKHAKYAKHPKHAEAREESQSLLAYFDCNVDAGTALAVAIVIARDFASAYICG